MSYEVKYNDEYTAVVLDSEHEILLYECTECAALVRPEGMYRHTQFHNEPQEPARLLSPGSYTR